MQSDPSSDLPDISKDFESIEMLKYCQAIKGFDNPDFVAYNIIYHWLCDIWFFGNPLHSGPV